MESIVLRQNAEQSAFSKGLAMNVLQKNLGSTRILINGYPWGGNTPPFIAKFKELGCKVKLVCPLYFSKEHLFKEQSMHECLVEDDIIIPKYSVLEKLFLKDFIRVCNNVKINSLWMPLVTTKMKKVIEIFKPDIIYNHTFSRATHIMSKTGFRPQVSFPFGSDVMGINAWKDFNIHQEIIRASEYVISALPTASEFFIEKLKVPKEKLTNPIPFGLPHLNELLSDENSDAKNKKIREKFGVPDKKIILIETRGLRRHDGGAIALVKAFKKVEREGVFLIMTKGFSGDNRVVDSVKNLISKLGLNSKIKIIEDVLSYKDVIGLYRIADINLSLLPHDVLGKSIMEAISQDCLLILTDLKDYRIAFGNNAEYVEHDNVEDIGGSIRRMINLNEAEMKRQLMNNKEWLIKNQCFDTNCKELLRLFENTIASCNK